MIPRLHPPESRLMDHVVGASDAAAWQALEKTLNTLFRLED